MMIKKSIKNKKGFTLIELLVTIALMLSILGIAIVSFINISNKKKEEAYKLVTEQIMTAAEQYFDSNEYLFNNLSEDAYGIITVGMLVKDDYLNKVTDPKSGNPINECSQVKVTKKNGRYISNYYEFNDLVDGKEVLCSNENKDSNKVVVKEPGGPWIDLEEEGTKGNNDWYVSEVTLKATVDTKGNGEITEFSRCVDGSCVSLGNIESVEDKIGDTKGESISYKVTNEHNKTMSVGTSVKVDTVPPTCGIRAYGFAKKAITDDNPDGEVGTYNTSYNAYHYNNKSGESISYTHPHIGETRAILPKNGWYTNSASLSYVRIFPFADDDGSGAEHKTYNTLYKDNVELTELLSKGESITEKQLTEDTAGTNFYGYAEDPAGNWSSCEITVKRDATPPTIKDATLSCDTTSIQNRIVLNITDNLSGFESAPFIYTHSLKENSMAKNNYFTSNSAGKDKYWHGFGFASLKKNIVTINEITVYDSAGNSREYKNNPISCQYPTNSSDGSGGRYPSGKYECPIGNPERKCTLNLN